MEHAVFGYLQADSSSPATLHHEARYALPTADTLSTYSDVDEDGGIARPEGHLRASRLATVARRGKGGTARAVRGPDLRQTRVLMQALCEMRLELFRPAEVLSPAALESRHTATMALWQGRERALYTQPEIEQGIETRLNAGFRHVRSGDIREAASEFKRAYLLLCCVLTLARDNPRGKATS